MDKTLDLYYNKVLHLVFQASKIFEKGYYETSKTISTKKGSWDLVTEYDKSIEEFLIGQLSEDFPSHKFLGEETTEEKTVLTDDPTWIIDPIDGTNNFAIKYPETAISIGLAIGKEVVLGVICNPVRNQTFSACKGKGAFLNGTPIRVSGVTDLEESVIGCEISLGRIEMIRPKVFNQVIALTSKSRGMRSVGCAALSLCYVAMGMWNAYIIEFLYPWDFAAGSIIIKEAGGTVTDTNGDKFDVMNGRILACGTEALSKEILDVIRKTSSSSQA